MIEFYNRTVRNHKTRLNEYNAENKLKNTNSNFTINELQN